MAAQLTATKAFVARGPTQAEPSRYGLISVAAPQGTQPRTSTWLLGNRHNLYPERLDYALMYCCNDFPDIQPTSAAPSFAAAQRHDFPYIGYNDAADLAPLAVLRAGAFPRDPMDRRLNDAVERGQIIGWVEGFKAISDLFCVAGGKFEGGNPVLN